MRVYELDDSLDAAVGLSHPDDPQRQSTSRVAAVLVPPEQPKALEFVNFASTGFQAPPRLI